MAVGVNASTEATTSPGEGKTERATPLPGWLVKAYYVFPVILYVPDVIFNYFVYSDGAGMSASGVAALPQLALWGALSVGIVGMAYLLSYLAPWHWAQGHYLQSLLCWIGVFAATGITIWNSMAYRSIRFTSFATDAWANSWLPGLADAHISFTMILVAIAPPFWGLFWALVQPTRHHKALAAEDFEQEKLRLQQQAELAELKAKGSRAATTRMIGNLVGIAAAAKEEVNAQLLRSEDVPPRRAPTTTPSTTATITEDGAPPSGSAPLSLDQLRRSHRTRQLQAGVSEYNLRAASLPSTGTSGGRTRKPKAVTPTE